MRATRVHALRYADWSNSKMGKGTVKPAPRLSAGRTSPDA